MALPSSPPLLPETDVPDSPPFPSDEAGELPIRPSPLPFAGRSRKRQLSDYGSLSSDPLFSEGTSEAEEEGGDAERRRKRLVKGPWWSLRRSSARGLRQRMARRDRMRNADSGVWLGSDLSDDSIDSTRSSQRRISALGMEHQLGPSTMRTLDAPHELSPAHAFAARTINDCLETGRERVDLTDLGLAFLSNETLKPLHQLIRHSHTNLTQPPSEDEFRPLTPSIQLFLSGNKLPTLPSELFRLTNISVLSLRNNDLSNIPPAIGRLPILQELNIAQNNVKWLPWEMLDLMHCRGTHRQITIRPNPLVDPIDKFGGPSPLPMPKHTSSEYNEHLDRWGEIDGAFFRKMKQWHSEEDVPWSMRHELELRLKLGRLKQTMYQEVASRSGKELKLCNEQLVYLASSAVKFFDVNGFLCRNIYSTNTSLDDHQFAAVVDPLASRPSPTDTSGCPSLFEFALRSIQANFTIQETSDIPEGLSKSVTAALQQAARGVEHGNERCAVCGTSFILARAEWMEYWFNGFPSQKHLTSETVLPFLRRACSWTCACQPNDLGACRF